MKETCLMALSLEELELQTAEYLPEREVMSGGCRQKCGGSTFLIWTDDNNSNYQHGLLNVNVQDVNILAFD
jgi:hypothetical protein